MEIVTDPFTSASPTYIAAQRTNQARETGWCFSPDPEDEPMWSKAFHGFLRGFGKWYVWFALVLVLLPLWLLVEYGG